MQRPQTNRRRFPEAGLLASRFVASNDIAALKEATRLTSAAESRRSWSVTLSSWTLFWIYIHRICTGTILVNTQKEDHCLHSTGSIPFRQLRNRSHLVLAETSVDTAFTSNCIIAEWYKLCDLVRGVQRPWKRPYARANPQTLKRSSAVHSPRLVTVDPFLLHEVPFEWP